MNVRIPLWILRFGDNATIDFSESDGDIVGDLDVTLEDVDHHGPGWCSTIRKPTSRKHPHADEQELVAGNEDIPLSSPETADLDPRKNPALSKNTE